MKEDVRGPLEQFLESLEESGFRGLVALRGERTQLLEALLDTSPGGRSLFFYSHKQGKPHFQARGSQWGLEDRRNSLKYLGHEFKAVALEVDDATRASSVAALGETVVSGGFYALLFPTDCREGEESETTPAGGLPHYLWSRAHEADSLFLHDLCRGGEPLFRPPRERAERPSLEECGPSARDRGAPGLNRVMGLARTCDQARALAESVEAFLGAGRGVLVLGDRGRGKSGVLALFLAWLARGRRVGYVPVVAPSLYSVQSLFGVLEEALRLLGLRARRRVWRGLVEAVSTGGFTAEYVEPGSRVDSEVVVVDEAGALGVARVLSSVRRSRFFLASTTVHGYEGGGKSLARRLSGLLEGVVPLELSTPIRYPPGDPLERWLYDVFLLDAEPPALGELQVEALDPRGLEATCVPGGIAVGEWGAFREAYGILATAHYRNNPDDLQLLLENPSHVFCVLKTPRGTPLSVAQVNLDDPMLPHLVEGIYGLRPTGVARVVRIATHPRLWGRGLGSRLLSTIESHARQRGRGLVGAVFSNPDALSFWLRNGYRVVHVSPRYNRFTGEKNIAVLKSLSEEHASRVECLAVDMRWRLALGLPLNYWDLDPRVALRILTTCPQCPREPLLKGGRLGEEALMRLFSERVVSEGPEMVSDLALAAIIASLPHCGLAGLGEEDALLLITLAQGRRSPEWPGGGLEPRRLRAVVQALFSS